MTKISKKKEMEYKIQSLEMYKKMWENTAHNLMLLINNEPRLVCPACRSRLYYSVGYPDGDVMALCSFAHRCCVIFYYTVTGIHSQDELDKRYDTLVNMRKDSLHAYAYRWRL